MVTINKGLLEGDELGEVLVVQRIRLPEIAPRVELIEPGLLRRDALLEEEHHRLHTGPQERAARAVEDGVEVAALQQFLAQRLRGIIRVREKRVLDDDSRPPTGFQPLDEVLQEEERGLTGLHREVLLHLFAFLPTEGRIRQDDVKAVRLLNVGEVLAQCVDMHNIRRVDAVQNQIHDPDDVGQRFFLFAKEGVLMESCELRGREFLGAVAEVDVGLTQEPGRPARRVINRFAKRGVDDLHHGADKRPGGVVLAAVAPGVTHVPNLGFVEVTELVFLVLRAEAEAIDEFQGVTE